MAQRTVPSQTEAEETKQNKKDKDRRRAILAIPLILLLSCACVLCSSQSALWFVDKNQIPASMLSQQQADYGPGALIALAPLDRDRIIAEIIGDEEALLSPPAPLSGVGAVAAIAILPKPLPVATATPIPLISTPTSQPTPANTALPTTEATQTQPDNPIVDTPIPLPTTAPATPVPTSPPPTVPPPTSPPPTSPPPTLPPPTSPPPTVPPPTSPPPTSPPPTSTPIPPPSIAFVNANYSVIETDGNVSVTVMLSAASAQTITVNYATSDGTATAGSDYGAISGSLTFTPGQTSQTIGIPVYTDAVVDPNETFNVTLSSPVNATLGTPNPTVVTIIDNTPTVQFSSATYSVNEDGGTATITVTLSAAVPVSVTVNYATSNGTAAAGSDYTAVSGTLNFAPTQTSLTFSVPITNDNLANEGNETVVLTLSNSTNAALSTPNPATLTIVDNDTAIVDFIKPQFSVNEGNDGGTGLVSASVVITLSNPSVVPVTVNYVTSDGTATAGVDYISASGTITFAPTETVQNFFFNVISDTVVEADETITLTLSSPVSATIGPLNPATLLIIDDDPSVGCSSAGIPGGEPNIGLPNGTIAELNCGTDLIVSLPPTSTIIADGDSNFDMVYYEYANAPGIQLDWVVVQIGTSSSGPWYTVFYWGDNIVDENTNIGQAGYGSPTEAVNAPISSADLYNNVGIAIDVDARVPFGTYSFVRFYSPFGTSDPAQVDAISLYP